MENKDKVSAIILGGHGISDDFLISIGRFSIKFSHLELSLKSLCNCIAMIGNSQLKHLDILTSELSFRQLRNTAISLLIEENVYDEHKTTMDSIKVCEERRNTIFHSYYGSDIDSVYRQKRRNHNSKGLVNVSVEMTSELINGYAKEADDLADTIFSLATEFVHKKKA